MSDWDASLLMELAGSACRRWDLAACSLELVAYRENAVFRVQQADGRAVALRVHRAGYQDRAGLLSEQRWMADLGQEGIRVPAVVASTDGSTVANLRHPRLGERLVDVLTWIDALPLAALGGELVKGDRSDGAFVALGRLLSRLHNQAEAYSPPADFSRPAWDADGLIGSRPHWGGFWLLEGLDGETSELLQAARDRLHKELSALETAPGGYGLIHADVTPDNVLMKDGVLWLIDFDDAGWGWYLFDIATTLFRFLGSRHFGRLQDRLLHGYRSLRPLGEAEERRLTAFLVARGLSYLGWLATRPETDAAREHADLMIRQTRDVAAAYLSREFSDEGMRMEEIP